MKHPTPEAIPRHIADDSAQLLALLEEATSVQWQRSRTVAEVEDAGIRSKGLVSRPTEDTATDPVRLALRTEVDHSIALLLRTQRDLWHARQRLARALDEWAGDPSD